MHVHTTRLALCAIALGATASAGLLQTGFITPTDGLLINDSVTHLQWLTPVYTRGHTYNDSVVQSVITSYGFRYATATEATDLINRNFGNPPTMSPGTPAGYTAATAFMNLFGVAEYVTCGAPCPRTQGLTSDIGTAGTHLGFGMITVGSNGWALMNNAWPDTIADTQMGSFLVRATPTAAPEPASAALVGLGILAVLFARRRVT